MDDLYNNTFKVIGLTIRLFNHARAAYSIAKELLEILLAPTEDQDL